MIFYNDEYVNCLEKSNKWLDSIDYLCQKLLLEKNNILLFRKAAINMWYTLSIDDIDIYLTNEQRSRISKKLCDFYNTYQNNFLNDSTCEWIFGYMMEVQPIFFLNSELNLEEIERVGKNLIKNSSDKGDLIAKILYCTRKTQKEIKLKYKQFEKVIEETFDSTKEIDKYFIEILKNCIKDCKNEKM